MRGRGNACGKILMMLSVSFERRARLQVGDDLGGTSRAMIMNDGSVYCNLHKKLVI